MLMLNYVNNLATETEKLLSELINTFHLLELGQLPPQLVNMQQLDKFLKDLSKQLLVELPDYEIASTVISEYYRPNSVIWGISNSSIMINIPVMITEKRSRPFELYQVQHFHVPTEIKIKSEEEKDSPASYTRIETDFEYIAIKHDVYILMTAQKLKECTNLKGTLFCSELLVQTQRTEESCLSALYWKADLGVVTKNCQIMYYHDLKPSPAVYEDKEYVYLVNVEASWRLSCLTDNFPHRYPHGSNYAAISKKSLCGCEIIIGADHYIARTRSGCDAVSVQLDLRYPVNSIMLYNLRDRVEN